MTLLKMKMLVKIIPLLDEITRERPLPRPENQSEAKEKLEKTMMNDDGICICGDWTNCDNCPQNNIMVMIMMTNLSILCWMSLSVSVRPFNVSGFLRASSMYST